MIGASSVRAKHMSHFEMLLDEAEVGETEIIQKALECEVEDVIERKRSRRACGWTGSADQIRCRTRIVSQKPR